MRKMEDDLGFSPASRSKIELPQPKADGGFEDFMSGPKGVK
jgi:hypothetical protein